MAGGGFGQLGRSISTSIGSFFDPTAQMQGEMMGLQRRVLEDQITQRRSAEARAQAEFDAKQAEIAAKAPDASRLRVMAALGIPENMAPEVTQYQQSGRIDRFDPNAGPAQPAPEWASPDALGKFGKLFAADRAVVSGAAPNQADALKAPGALERAILDSQIASGGLAPTAGGARVAALEGKPLFNANEYGVMNNFSGAMDTNNPAAQRFGQLRDSQAAAQRANAVQSYASAGASNASRDKTRAEITDLQSSGGKAPAGYRWAAPGQLEPIPGGPADPSTKGAKQTKPPTEGQAKALMFGSRMAVSDEVLNELGMKGVTMPSLMKQGAESIPVIGGVLGMGANAFASADQQQVEQAQRDFINAVLRRESGAAIADSEFKNAQRQYFPQPGDSQQVIQQKAANRQTAIAGMKAEFGDQSAPEFNAIVEQARAARQSANPRRSSGAVGGAPAQPGTPPVQITSDADYAALPSGTRFLDPRGQLRVKP